MSRSAAAPVLLAALLFASPAPAGEESPPPLLTAENYAALRDGILPGAGEEAWRAIPWRPSLLAAAREARAQGKPILLWAMNGHPLACT